MLLNAIHFIFKDPTGLLVELFFAFTIVLMVFDKQKPPLTTSVLTGTALIVLGFGGSFNAFAVGLTSILNGVLWLVLGWQRYNQRKTTTKSDAEV